MVLPQPRDVGLSLHMEEQQRDKKLEVTGEEFAFVLAGVPLCCFACFKIKDKKREDIFTALSHHLTLSPPLPHVGTLHCLTISTHWIKKDDIFTFVGKIGYCVLFRSPYKPQ